MREREARPLPFPTIIVKRLVDEPPLLAKSEPHPSATIFRMHSLAK